MRWIANANRWFDRLPEPWRFTTFICGVAFPVGCFSAFGPLWLFLAIALALIAMRCWWLKIGAKQHPSPAIDGATGGRR